jgi:general secretion pathway protein G
MEADTETEMPHRTRKQRGLTYIELMVTATVLIVLAGAAVPMFHWDQKRRKEVKLRTYLQQMRESIDLYKKYVDEGRILQEDVEQRGYPPDFEALIEGVTVAPPVINDGGTFQPESADGKLIRFLKRMPVDPITGEAAWGMRSYQDEWDSTSWGGENLYDVYSLSDKKALDGTYYKDW